MDTPCVDAPWVDTLADPNARPLRVLQVTVRRPAPTWRDHTSTSEVSFTGLYRSTFEAYDDALLRFEDALRIEVQPAEGKQPSTVPVVYPTKPSEAAHAPC